MTVVAASPPARTLGRGTTLSLVVVSIVGLIFLVIAAFPYFALNEQQFRGYWPRRGWLLLHIAGGMAALLAGPVQLWLGLSDRRMNVHRRLGIAYIAAVAVSSFAAFYLAANTDFGWTFGAGLSALAVAWLITTGMAFLAARRFLFDQHKEWMIRSYVVTFAFVMFRIIFGVQQIPGVGVGTIQEQLATTIWLSWTIPLLVTEAVLQGRKMRSVAH